MTQLIFFFGTKDKTVDVTLGLGKKQLGDT